jgi:Domain of unknown function (DUF4412)
MKSVLSVLFLSLLIICFIPIKSFSQSFEGKIVMQISSKDQDEPQVIDYYCKGSKIRFESKSSGGGAGTMVLDTKDNNALIIIPQQKMYMTYSYKNALGAASDTLKNKIKEEMEKGDIKITGETKDINGFKCEKWIFKDDEGKSGEAWMTKGIGNFFFFSNPMRPDRNEPEWQQKLTNEGYFPMMVISKDADGSVESKMEVTSIEKKSLDESLFTPPADYKKMDIPMMMHHGN